MGNQTEEAKPPIVTREAEWTIRTYRDGSWVKTRMVGTFLEISHSWPLHEATPSAVQEQDLAAMQEAAAASALRLMKMYSDEPTQSRAPGEKTNDV